MPANFRETWVAIALCAFTSAINAADDFPYEAYVAIDDAEVVAGPGHRYYATQRLSRGAKIEIFREEASGWLAIRPPEGAFSWVPAKTVERSPDNDKVGRVKETIAAWIGTAVERVNEHRQQVTLKPGEVVQILGEKSVASNSGEPETWLKIAPPAGEFRWIHLRDVSRQIPEIAPRNAELPPEVAENDQAGPRLLTQTELPTESESPPEPRRLSGAGNAIALRDIAPISSRLDPRVEPTQYRGSKGAAETKPISPDGFVPRKRRGDGALQTDSPPTTGQRTLTSSPARPRVDLTPRIATSDRPIFAPPASAPRVLATPKTGAEMSADEVNRQLDQVDVELSLMLAQDKSLWNLPALRERTERLVEGGADPTSRGRARLVLDKIKQFEGAFDVEDYGPIRQGASAKVAATTAASGASAAPSTPLADPRYDAQGWLKPVISRKGDKPAAPYAVVDQDGKPLCFITPAPGLNLQAYLNKQVGVYGRRGYLEELKKSHLTAERVIDLDRTWR